MNQDQALKLIAARLSGNISTTDREHLTRWERSNPQHASLVEEATLIWERSGVILSGEDDWNTESDWLRLEQTHSRSNDSDSAIFSGWSVLKVAAAILLAVTSYFLIDFLVRKTDRSEIVTIAAGEEPASISLPDGSYVTLEANGEVRHEKNFTSSNRHVILEGSGFFDVKRDSVRPFEVVSGNGLIKVLGTAFSVSRDSLLFVTVSSGLVSFASVNAPDEPIFLSAGEAASLAPTVDARPVKLEKRKKEAPVTPDRNPLKEADVPNNTTEHRASNSEVAPTEEEDVSTAGMDSLETSEATERVQPSGGARVPWSVTSEWKKNDLNQTVVEGRLRNQTNRAYRNIVLEITCSRPGGKASRSRVTVYETVLPGQEIDYKASLMDLFGRTRDVEVNVVDMEAVPE